MTTLSHAKITLRLSSARGHANHGWLDSHHTFSFASYEDPAFQSFGALRVLNEDRVAGHNGFPTHSHQNAEIFSYVLSGELTHRDSMSKGGAGASKDEFFKLRRGDVQFTTGGKGIAHSEQNEAEHPVHFLQIWVLPWSRNLTPRYHTSSFADAPKRLAFVPFISPLAAGPGASETEETAAVPAIPGTIPIHADAVVSAGIVEKGKTLVWRIGGGEGAVRKHKGRRVYVHVAEAEKKGGARVRLDGGLELGEGDGAFVEGVDVGEELRVEGVGMGEAEVVMLDLD